MLRIKFYKIFLLALMFAVNATAQHAEKIKKDAETMCKATLSEDFNTLANYTHPKLITALGGKDKMVETLKKGFSDMKAKGGVFFDASVGDAGEVLSIGTELYSILPQKVVLKFKDVKISSVSSLVAVSKDNGTTWYFIDAGGMTDDQFKQMLPAAYGKLKIPKKTEPLITRD